MARPSPLVLVLGTGSAGSRHLRTLAAAGARPVAVPARRERAAELRREGVDVEEDLTAALARKPAGAVVATDSGRHADDAERCLEVCPVLVEKPLAVSGSLARRIASAAVRTRHAVHVACCLRFDPGLRWVRERLPAIGAIHHADAECLSWLPAWRPGRDVLTGYGSRPAEGGVLLDLVHEIDYLSWFLGPPTEVQATLENRGILGLPREVEETARLSLRHPGVTSTLRLSYAARPATRRLRVWGERGLLEWNGVDRVARHLDIDGGVAGEQRWSGSEEMYRLQAEAWLGTLTGGAATGLVGVDEGVAAVAVCDASRASSASGRWEPIR